jgi:hypothetical protein
MSPPEPSWEQPGGLGIKEKRSWATWQFVAAIVVAALIGMAIGHSGGGSSSASGAGGGQTLRTLPPASPTTNPTTVTTTLGASATSTTAASGPSGSGPSGASGAPTTTAKSGATTTTAPAGPQTYLVHNLQGTGPTNLPAFSIAGGGWSIGWAYRCVLAPGGAAKFQIVGGTAKAVNEQGRDGSGTTQETKAGAQQLRILTDPACEWAVTVVGVAG